MQKNVYFDLNAPLICTKSSDGKNYNNRRQVFNADFATGVSLTATTDNSATANMFGNLTLS